MPAVTSSAILRIEYDAMARQLQITFVTGNVYAYYGVPRSVYAQFLEAPSKGTFFNEFIRDQYRFEQILMA